MVNTEITLIIVFAAKDGEVLYSQQKQDQEWMWLTPFSYDLNQIPYDYTVKVTSRFKGLDLIDRVPEELWTEVPDIVWEGVIRSSSRKRNAKRQNGCLRSPYLLNLTCEQKISERQRRNGKICPFECRVPKNIKER